MITKDKKYTSRLGLPVTIYEIYENEIHGVIHCCDSLILTSWTKEGLLSRSGEKGSNDLIEVSPYADWKIDDKFIVWASGSEKYHRHFAGLDARGIPLFFNYGLTSWSASDKIIGTWPNFEPFIEGKKDYE